MYANPKIALLDIYGLLTNKKNNFTDYSQITHIRQRAYPPFYKEHSNSVPFSLSIDSNGFVSPVMYYDKPDTKIVFLGGSTTECKYVTDTLRFPYLVGKLLEEKFARKVTSINSGVCGNNSMHSVNLIVNKILPLQPDYIILMENVNDWSTLLTEGTYWNDNPSTSLVYNDP